MSLLSNINNVAFTSRYSIDKVSLKESGSASVATAAGPTSFTTITIPHTLGYTPACIGVYTDQSDYSTYYQAGLPPYFYFATAALYLPRIDASISSDSSNVYVKVQNLDTTRTIYAKVVGLIPYDITSSPVLDSSKRDDELINATDNFLKVYIESSQSVTMSTSSTRTITVPHNLGYRPSSLIHIKNNGIMRQAGNEVSFDTSIGYTTRCYEDETNLYIEITTTSASGSFTAYYNIYLDD